MVPAGAQMSGNPLALQKISTARDVSRTSHITGTASVGGPPIHPARASASLFGIIEVDPRRPTLEGADLLGNRRFESTSLQRGIRSEPCGQAPTGRSMSRSGSFLAPLGEHVVAIGASSHRKLR
jgi:hypothetical protein